MVTTSGGFTYKRRSF